MNIKLVASFFRENFSRQSISVLENGEIGANSKSRCIDKGVLQSRSMAGNWRHRVRNPFGNEPFGKGHNLWILCVTFEDGVIEEEAIEKYEWHEQDTDWQILLECEWWEEDEWSPEFASFAQSIIDISDEGLL
jgi:hypothetical protein